LRRARKLGQVATTCEEPSRQVYDMRVTLVKSLRRARNCRGRFTSCEESWSSRYDMRGTVGACLRRARNLGWSTTGLGMIDGEGKRLELVDALARHKVDIACFQETKWKGSSNIEGNGYKLWYSSSPTARNGVGVILKACLKDIVVHVNRCSDRIISLTIVINGETVNVISAYAPQVGLRGDLNGHIEAVTEGYAGVHRGFGYGVRN
ncbi:cleavage/polyadenylation specificity factor, 25kDa subunit, partial [Tanacetum coccineum]